MATVKFYIISIIFSFNFIVFPISASSQIIGPIVRDSIAGNSPAAVYFLALAQGYAGSRGYQISEASQRELLDRLEVYSTELTNDESAQIEAQRQLFIFVSRMIDFSGVPGGDPLQPNEYSMLGETQFFSALEALCPVWPICK